MTTKFDKECQHHSGEHVELGRRVAEASEEGHKLFNLGHIEIIVTVPSHEGKKHFSSEHTRPWISATVASREGNQGLSSEHTQPWMSATLPSQVRNQRLNSEHTRPWMSATVPYQDGNQRLSSEHTRQRIDMTVQFHKGYHHQDPEYARPWIGVTVPYMKGDEQHHNECPELGIELKTAQVDLQPCDTLPAEYKKFLSAGNSYKDTWQHRNALSGLVLYEMFKMCNENEIMCMFGQESHVACSVPPTQISPVILACPLRMHPVFFCSWLGFQNYRHEHLDAVHRDCLVRGTSVELKVDGLSLLSALNEVFLCYTVLETHNLMRRSTCLLLQSV